MKCVSMTIAVGVVLACGPALAIPPPWTLEETKAQADLVVIARMTKVEPVQDLQRANSRIGFEPVEVLKGQLDQKKPEDSKVFLLFSRPEDRPGPGGIQATFAFQAAKDPSLNKTMTAVLINDVAAY